MGDLQQITMVMPDDWHLHLRDGAMLEAVVRHTTRCFRRAIVMPNLKPALNRVEAVLRYRERILAATPPESRFEPMMTLYLTDDMPLDEIDLAVASGVIHGAKLYPAGATTHSDQGVSSIERIWPLLERMERCDLPLLVHGEVTGDVDPFDREARFVETTLARICDRFPSLRVVLEHVTTREGVDFVYGARDGVAATVTAHHLLYNRSALFAGGIRPHYFCLPILKREQHRQALLTAVSSGSKRFFLGTDSAPHAVDAKESGCGCAGIYTAHAAIELYAEAFDAIGALDRLESFASRNGPLFYRLEPNRETITLERKAWQVPESYRLSSGESLVPLRAGERVGWRLSGRAEEGAQRAD